jgi:sporulation protein YlmC with PRC-barrel domain
VFAPVIHRQVPLGELLIKREIVIAATDGRVGRVDELRVNPEDDSFTHLVVRERHFWSQKYIVIPASEIERTDE